MEALALWCLALETSSSQTSVCLSSSNGIVLESQIQAPDSHSESLAIAVQDLLACAKIRPSDLQLILVGAGPGSFTGLRIGYSFAKGLALSLRCPMLAISSLRAAAFEFRDRFEILCSLRDARREEVFFEVFRRSGTAIQSLDGPCIIRAQEVTSRLEALAKSSGALKEATRIISPEDLSIYGLAAITPGHGARELVELWKAELRARIPNFDLQALIELEPTYMRAVAAKTIAERKLSVKN